ncbi:MAG: biotin-requiring enzyme [bacterium]|jgi:pyruvate/2-oxoglutarate dehydrogenase complex dihydrolipoamide acyltransferase (E2) component
MAGKRFEIRLPAMGMQSQEIIFSAWLKNPGDVVEDGDELFEVESDKATVVFEAEHSGVLAETLVKEGAVKEGDLLGYIDAR